LNCIRCLELGVEGGADRLHQGLSDENGVEGSAAEELIAACEELKTLCVCFIYVCVQMSVFMFMYQANDLCMYVYEASMPRHENVQERYSNATSKNRQMAVELLCLGKTLCENTCKITRFSFISQRRSSQYTRLTSHTHTSYAHTGIIMLPQNTQIIPPSHHTATKSLYSTYVLSENQVAPDPADLDSVLLGCGERHRVELLGRVVDKLDARSCPEKLSCLIGLRCMYVCMHVLMSVNGTRTASSQCTNA
jgi:hypothetical protein